MRKGIKVKQNSLRNILKALQEEVIVEEGVTKETLTEEKDQEEVTLTLLA